MKTLIVITLSLMLTLHSATVALSPQQTVIPAGTPITVRLRDTITTKTAKKGHRVLTDVEEPSTLPPGSMIVGELLEAKRSGRIWGRAKLKFDFNTLQLPNGQKIKIKAVLHRIGNLQTDSNKLAAGSTIGRDVKTGLLFTFLGGGLGAGGAALANKGAGGPVILEAAKLGGAYGAAVGAGIGFLTLLRRGKELEIGAGTEIVLILNEAVRF